jgi:hypothetical protein
MKSAFKRMRGTSDDLRESYLAQFVWEINFLKNNDVFSSLLYCIRQKYRLN